MPHENLYLLFKARLLERLRGRATLREVNISLQWPNVSCFPVGDWQLYEGHKDVGGRTRISTAKLVLVHDTGVACERSWNSHASGSSFVKVCG